jgi:hypothetical protein
MLMVPLYAIASLIALFSLEAAFVIDVIRDIYEVWMPPYLPTNEINRLSYDSGIRNLLLLPALDWLYGRGTVPAHSSARTASEGRSLSVHSASPGARSQ